MRRRRARLNVNTPPFNINDRLVSAVRINYVEIITSLLEQGATLDIKTEGNKTLLHIAAEKGHLETAKFLLNKAVKTEEVVNSINDKGQTPLLLAVENCRESIVGLLLKRGANVNAKDINNNSPLYVAIQKRKSSVVDCILQMQPNIDDKVCEAFLDIIICDYVYTTIAGSLGKYIFTTKQEDVDNIHSLPAAVRKNHKKIVELFIARSADPNYKMCGSTLLQYAVENGHIEMIKLLLKAGCDVNAEASTGWIPLSRLFYGDDESKYMEIMELLLANGADLKEAPKLLHNAVREKNIEIVKFLIENGADVNSGHEVDDTPLHHTAPSYRERLKLCDRQPDEAKRLEIARLLLISGANANSQDRIGLTTLHCAIIDGWMQLVLLLLEFNADVNTEDEYGETPLLCAIQQERFDLAEILLKNRADVDALVAFGEQELHCCLLHIAAHRGLTEVAELLLKFDADVNATDCRGNTPLHCAIRQNQHKVIVILLQNNCKLNIKDGSGSTPIGLVRCEDNSDVDDTDYIEMYEQLGHFSSYGIKQYYSWSCSRQEYTDIEVVKAIINHANKLKACGIPLNISKKDKRQIDFMQLFFTGYDGILSEEDCKEELMKVKQMKISRHLTLYDLLINYANPAFIKDKTVLQTLESLNFSEFPIYQNLLETMFKKNHLMEKLLSEGKKWLSVLIQTHSVLHQQNPPLLLNELLLMIISYLDRNDLRSLIACGKGLKHQLSI